MADNTDTTRPGDGWSCPRCDRVEPHGHSLPVVGYVAADLATTRPGETEAVEAALRGFRHAKDPDGIVFPTFERRMQEAVAAAYPVIAAAVREQAAQDIEATDTPPGWWDWGDDHPCFGTGLELAAYIARGGR